MNYIFYNCSEYVWIKQIDSEQNNENKTEKENENYKINNNSSNNKIENNLNNSDKKNNDEKIEKIMK